MRFTFTYMICLIPALWGGMSAFAHAAPISRVRSLAGVEAVQVAVEDLNGATQKTGLQKGQIQSAAESYLVKQGLKVVRSAGGAPIVYIRLSSVIGGEQAQAPLSFYLTVQVKQFARLTRTLSPTQAAETPAEPPLLVTTWEDGTMVMLNRSELNWYVSKVLVNLLSALVQDHQEANGKGGA